MKLLYATGNQAKLTYMQSVVEGLDIELIGLSQMDVALPEVEETGNDPLENARIKAHAYQRALGVPLFSCDSGLFIQGLEPARQPGVHVRNVNGKRLSDEEMIAHYAGIAQELGGQCAAQYRNAICLILPDGRCFEHMGDDISGDCFILTQKPHPMRREGFPLDSLALEPASGRYYFDIREKRISSTMQGLRAFFERILAGAA